MLSAGRGSRSGGVRPSIDNEFGTSRERRLRAVSLFCFQEGATMRRVSHLVAAVGLVLACVSGAQAVVAIDTVTVGNPGNPDDTHGDGYGGVNYVYNIGKFEVTAGQYTEFLNSVAGVDTYGLYDPDMWSGHYGVSFR
jgi:hypothetical protein